MVRVIGVSISDFVLSNFLIDSNLSLNHHHKALKCLSIKIQRICAEKCFITFSVLAKPLIVFLRLFHRLALF